INKVGIGKATQMAVRKVIKIIQSKVKDEHKLFVLMDAFYIRYLRGVGLRNQKAIVKGDEKSLSIAAASIVAKVKRDGLMEKLDRDYPVYNWKMNKGYGTLDHRTAIKKNGKTKHHRDAFVKNVV
ncbi:ribonuclease HII, partial [Patescibacteria group bacterium]|nr:ribonuclease HII [Patescibacteria group bacterium]